MYRGPAPLWERFQEASLRITYGGKGWQGQINAEDRRTCYSVQHQGVDLYEESTGLLGE